MLNQFGGKVLHVAFAVETQGVTGMMLRSVVRGLNVLMKRTRMSLHDSLDAALRQALPYVQEPNANPEALSRDLRRFIVSLRHARAALSA